MEKMEKVRKIKNICKDIITNIILLIFCSGILFLCYPAWRGVIAWCWLGCCGVIVVALLVALKMIDIEATYESIQELKKLLENIEEND